jgi:SNF2 family DNA or RNA helicase
MRFKTTPMAHQLIGFDLLKNKEAFALLMEQGTGKTKVIIDDAARLWGEGKIDAMLVIAPNGVHTKWVTIELPKHMPDWCPFVAAYYSAGASKRHQATIEKLFDRTPNGEARPLRVLTMNVEALATTEGIRTLDRFIDTFNAIGVLDESQRFKNPTAVRTKEMIKRRRRFPVRRIMTGTPVTKAPFDVFTQFSFLDPTILRTSSYAAFKSEYGQMLPDDHFLVKKLQKGAWAKKDGSASKRVPQIIARDQEGLPIYQNLDKLNRLLAKHSYRVLKKDCLDLPDKVYDVIPFEMTPRQQDIYTRMQKELRADLLNVIGGLEKAGKKHGLTIEEALLAGRELIVANKLVALAKLQQITCGYMKLEDKSVVRMFKKVMDNPRNVAMMSVAEDIEGQMLFWAPHRDKIDQIIECLRAGFDDASIVRFDGATDKKARMAGVDQFQEGKARFFVANPASAATGLTLTKGETAFYYSDSFNWEHRAQSEDRNHRIGTTSARYFDLMAIGSIDETIAKSHAAKKAVADFITGDATL